MPILTYPSSTSFPSSTTYPASASVVEGHVVFAAPDDVAARTGVSGYTGAALDRVWSLLELATLEIASAAGKDETWAAALTPVPGTLRVICTELVARLLLNPNNASSTTEQLGAYSYSETYSTGSQNDSNAGLELTPDQERRVRRAVFGRTAGSVKVASLATELADMRGYTDLEPAVIEE